MPVSWSRRTIIHKLDTAFFSSLTGMSFRSFTDTVKVGKDSIPVIYNLIQLGTNLFSMSTDSYILKGTTQGRNYETHLTQTLAREASGQWHETVHDSAYVPVTFYDFRGDLTNPEFNMGATDMAMKGMVQNALDAQRKPVPNTNSTLRTRMLNWYNPSWYLSSYTPNQRFTTWQNAASNSGHICLMYFRKPTWLVFQRQPGFMVQTPRRDRSNV